MNNIRQICVCSHDIDTHFEKEAACLAAKCDCQRYRDDQAHQTPATGFAVSVGSSSRKGGRPHGDLNCCCSLCIEWDFTRYITPY